MSECRLKNNKTFAELASLDKSKQEQIDLFLDKDLIRTDSHIASVASYLGFVSEKERDILLQKEAFNKLDSSSKDFNDLLSGKLNKEELPEVNLGKDGKAYPVNSGGEKVKAISSVAEISEAMLLLYENKSNDSQQHSYVDAYVLQAFEAAKRVFDDLEKNGKADPNDKKDLFEGFSIVIGNIEDDDTKKLATEFIKNRKIEINNCGISAKKRVQQTTR